MEQFGTALAFALLPAFGNVGGGLIAEFIDVQPRLLSLALHIAAGIVLAVVGIELAGKALAGDHPLWMATAFLAGGACAIGLDRAVDVVQCRFGSRTAGSAPWMIYAGVCIDLFSDGMMIGAGTTVATSLALLLALGQVSADVPEGFATMATFRKENVSRRRRLLIAVSFVFPVLAGTSVGYWAVRDAPTVYKLMLLSLTGGMLMTIAVEEMVVQAHAVQEGEERGWQTLGLAAGFALFMAVSSMLTENT